MVELQGRADQLTLEVSGGTRFPLGKLSVAKARIDGSGGSEGHCTRRKWCAARCPAALSIDVCCERVYGEASASAKMIAWLKEFGIL